MSPEDYFPILLTMLGERLPEIKLSRQYVDGDAPLPEMGKNLRESWETFQKKSRTNLGGKTCQSLVGRIRPIGIRSVDELLAVEARKFWRDNRLGTVFADAIWDAVATGYGYILTQDVDGVPIPTRERPEQMITIPDPLQPWRAVAALKAWRDKIRGVDYATVWVPGVEQKYRRDAKSELGGYKKLNRDGWEVVETTEYLGGVPVHTLENEFGVSEVTPHRDVIDRINLGKLQRLTTVAMQAYKQRAIEGGLPEEDEDGNSIDYSKIFEPAPGAIWDLPAGVKIWESTDGAAGIQAMLSGEEKDIREYCGVTGTPMSIFLPDAQNQSAEGAINAKEGEIAKAEKRIDLFRPALEGAVIDAMRIQGVDTAETLEIQFAPAAHVSWQEKASAASLAKASGMSLRWVARHIWGMSEDEFAEMQADVAAEQMDLLALTGAAGGDAA